MIPYGAGIGHSSFVRYKRHISGVDITGDDCTCIKHSSNVARVFNSISSGPKLIPRLNCFDSRMENIIHFRLNLLIRVNMRRSD